MFLYVYSLIGVKRVKKVSYSVYVWVVFYWSDNRFGSVGSLYKSIIRYKILTIIGSTAFP